MFLVCFWLVTLVVNQNMFFKDESTILILSDTMCQNIGNDLPTCLACGEHSMSRLVFVRVVQGYHFLAGLASWVACAKKCKVFVRESSTSFMSSMNIPITLTITRKCSSQHQILYNNFCNFIEISSYMDACV